MKLITERNLIYAYTPLDIHNPHKKNFPLPFSDQGTEVHGDYWGAQEYMIYDLMADALRKIVYQNSKPGKAVLKRNISIFSKYTVETNFRENKLIPGQRFTFLIVLKELRSYYPFVNKYTPKKFYHLVERASKIRIICNYRYKINNIESAHNFNTDKSSRREQIAKFPFRPKEPQNIFDFEYDEKNESYKIYLQSGLGALFSNNILAAEWEWLPFEFFELSKNAQNLYRKFILTKKENTEVRLSYLEIAKCLKLMTPNQTAKRKTIEKLLSELTPEYIEFERVAGYKNDCVFSIKKTISN